MTPPSVASTVHAGCIDPAGGSRVLCVDLDGTLVATDLLWESLMSALRSRPWAVLALPYWLSKGRAHLKRRLAEISAVDFASLPYKPGTLRAVGEAFRLGRHTVLATASDRILADGVSNHLGIFREVLASDGVTNLKGHTKAAILVKRYGSGNFDYIGDSPADVPCWAEAADAITVGVVPVQKVPHLRELTPADAEGGSPGRLRMLVRALRPHQWLKNLLLAVPAIGAHELGVSTLLEIALAFVSLSLVASGGYVLNDLLDLAADRRHPRKKGRPFASGSLSLLTGVTVIGLTWVVGFGIAALTLPAAFAWLVLVYLVGTAAYSISLKRVAVLDVLFLAGLYVIRVVGGGLATGVPVSTWLLAVTLFVCLSLAFLKRFIEVRAKGGEPSAAVLGRGYQADDAIWLQSAGLSTAYIAVLVLALYVNNPDVMRLYAHPERLLFLCPVVLYGATRVWLEAHRGKVHDDPLVAVAMDPVTYVLASIAAAVALTAI